MVEMAQSMGARGLRVRRRSEVHAVISEALRAPGPVVVDADMDVGSAVYNPVSFTYASDFGERGLARPPF
jgi:thiamine pyrophosphate-dependent acetolactate synthase large subunit-like protein